MAKASINEISKVFEDKLTVAGEEMNISLHVLPSFTERIDVALKINGKVVEVGDIQDRRGGHIWYNKRKMGSLRLDEDQQVEPRTRANENNPDIDDM